MKAFLLTLLCSIAMMQAQESQKFIPQITISGEGKVKTLPDQVLLSFGVNNSGKDAAEVKKLNDTTLDKIIKLIKRFGIAPADYQTTQVSLHKSYETDKKKEKYFATQRISLLLKDISKYDALVMALVDEGVTIIDQVEFKSSKLESLKSEARKLAILDAKKKAQDYVEAINQKVGKAIQIMDTSQPFYPQIMSRMTYDKVEESSMPKETLAPGEIEIVNTITVSFILE